MLYAFFQNVAFNFFENRHSNYSIFLGCGLICLTPEQLKDVMITFLISLIFLEKKEANSLHLLTESISLGIWLGGIVSLSTVKTAKKSACFV